MCDLTGKVALVSGAGQGIGARTAEVLAEAGAVVIVTGRTDAPCEAVVERIRATGFDAHFRHLDVTREDDWRAVMDDVCARFGGLDVLVNNAGVELVKRLSDTTLEEWHWICRNNLDGVFLGSKYGIHAMTEGSTTRPKGGSIINVSSVAGLIGLMGQAAYCTTKGGIRLFTKSVAHECGLLGNGVRVNSVHPGLVRSPMMYTQLPNWSAVGFGRDAAETERNALSMHPIGRLGEVDDVAKAIRYLASDDSSFVTGAELAVDGGFTAV